jgi:hypothetical protein
LIDFYYSETFFTHSETSSIWRRLLKTSCMYNASLKLLKA